MSKNMPKLAVYTLQIKNNKDDIFDDCFKSIKSYAEKCGADLISRYSIQDHKLSDEKNYKNIIMEKFFMRDLLSCYDRVLYVDADILIKNDAPNIFDYYDNQGYVYMYNEIKFNGVQYDKQVKNASALYNINWTKTGEHYDFFNAGVMLVNKFQKRLFTYDPDDYFIFDDLPMLVDEPYLHFNLFKYNIPIQEMDKRFNTMVYFEDDGWFLHFANVLDRKERIKKYL
jgi:lipopolysaccharide biosynthesis glycosyltransferase